MANEFHLYLPEEDKEITQSFLNTVAVSISLDSPYSVLKLSLTDINGVLTNVFKSGTPLVLVATLGDYTYNMDFKLLGCDRSETNFPSVVSGLELSFVSSWYFDRREGKPAYYGTPSTIIREVFEGGELYTLDVEDCANYPRVYYRLGSPITDFMVDVSSRGYKEGFPMMFYTDVNNIIRYKSVASMYSKDVSRYIIQNGASINGRDLSKVVAPLSLVFGTNVSTSHYLSNYEFLTDHFVGNTLVSPFKIGNAEVGSGNVYTPTQSTSLYMNWDMTPTDALGFSIRDSYSRNINTFNATALFLGWTDQFLVGDKVTLVSSAKTENDETAVGEGNYLVNSLTFLYDGSDQIPRTMATFIDANV